MASRAMLIKTIISEDSSSGALTNFLEERRFKMFIKWNVDPVEWHLFLRLDLSIAKYISYLFAVNLKRANTNLECRSLKLYFILDEFGHSRQDA